MAITKYTRTVVITYRTCSTESIWDFLHSVKMRCRKPKNVIYFGESMDVIGVPGHAILLNPRMEFLCFFVIAKEFLMKGFPPFQRHVGRAVAQQKCHCF